MPAFVPSRFSLHVALVVSRIAACSPSDKPPSQQQVEEAWKRTDQAIQQSHEAQEKRDQAEQLREIDRVRAGAEQAELLQQRQMLAGWAVGITLLCAALLLWLSLELRRRRVLQATLHSVLATKGANPREPTQSLSSPDLLA